jgi:hypothetical protein
MMDVDTSNTNNNSALPLKKDGTFWITLPSIGATSAASSTDAQPSMSDYCTRQVRPLELDRRFRWQVGVVQFDYTSTVQTVDASKSIITLTTYEGNATRSSSGSTLKSVPVTLPPREYTDTTALMKQFNDNVAAAITAARTSEQPVMFPTGASLVLSFDRNTSTYTLTPTKLGFEILTTTGAHLLALLGLPTKKSITVVDNQPVVLNVNTTSVTEANYSTISPAFYTELLSTTASNTKIELQVLWGYPYADGDTSTNTFVTLNLNVTPELAQSNTMTTPSQHLEWVNEQIMIKTKETLMKLKQVNPGSASACNPETDVGLTTDYHHHCLFTVTADKKVTLTCQNVNVRIDAVTGSHFIQLWKLPLNATRPGSLEKTQFVVSLPYTTVTASTPSQVFQKYYLKEELSGSSQTQMANRVRISFSKFEELGSSTVWLRVPPGEYGSHSYLCTTIANAIRADDTLQSLMKRYNASIAFDTITLTNGMIGRVTYHNCNISFPGGQDSTLVKMLGLSGCIYPQIPWTPYVRAREKSPLLHLPRALWVYLPDLVKDSIVMGQQTSLVKLVTMKGNWGEEQSADLGDIIYSNVDPSAYRINEVRVLITNSEGDTVRFEYGHVTLVLKFCPLLMNGSEIR